MIMGHLQLHSVRHQGRAMSRCRPDHYLGQARECAGRYTPRTIGKADSFIPTSLREWAYARSYASSAKRTAAIASWIDSCNLTRSHIGIADLTPWALENKFLGNDT
jgi:Integrase core domain